MSADVATEAMKIKNFIDGEWCDSSSGKYIERENPANFSQTVGRAPASTVGDARRAIEVAHKAFLKWREVMPAQRAIVLRDAIQIIRDRLDDMSRDLTLEQGKPFNESKGEIVRGLEEAEFFIGEACRIEGRHIPSNRAGTVCYTTREPIGVISAIVPWNYPFIAAMRKIAPAVVYGCSVVLKPARDTPFTSANIVKAFADAGLPAGVLNLVTGHGSEIGDELCSNPLVRGVSFTGSTPVGGAISQNAAKVGAKLQLEMGGKNPAIIFEGADLEKLAPEITGGALTCTGQRCTSISRVIVHKTLHDEIVDLIKAQMAKVVVGDGMDEKTTMGPLVSEEQLKSVLDYVKKGVDQGAKIACGGNKLTGGVYDKGAYMEPTLMVGVKPGDVIALEEVFGPVVSVIPFEEFDEALEIANSVAFGLAACAYTPRVDQALEFVKRIQVGMTQVNMPTYCDPHAPFGGVKASGQGAFSVGYSSIEFFTNHKAVYIQGQ